MYQNKDQNTIDIIDLLYLLLKKSLIILLVGMIFAACLGGYKIFNIMRASSVNNSSMNADVFDISNKLEGETDVQFEERIHDVKHANDLINSINVLNAQIENNRKYVSNSVFMQIDSENEALSTANFVVATDKNQSSGFDLALVSSYRQYIMSGEYLSPISEELNINQGYITELISATYETSSVLVNTSGDLNNVGIVSVTVIGPTIEFTDIILDAIIESVDAKCIDLNNSIVSHTVTVSARQSSYKVDSTTRDKQISITNRFESLQQQINNYDKSLDNISIDLGVDKSSIYSNYSISENKTSQNIGVSIKSVLKYSIIGFVFGIVLIGVIISLRYICGNKFITQAQFFSRFGWVYRICVNKPTTKRNYISRKIDVLTGNDNDLSIEKSNKLIANNIKNIISGMNNVLITGTADFSRIEDFIKESGINATVKTSFFNDPDVLEDISKYDGIIIVEQRNYSRCNLVAEEIKMIENSNTKLLGAIIL